MIEWLLAKWAAAKIYVMAAFGAIAAIAVALEYGRHKGEQSGEAKVASKAAQTALHEALEASKTQTEVAKMNPGSAQEELANEWARTQSNAKL